MTDYERGYAEGYKDGLHKYMPEVPSVSIPSLDAESAKPEPGDVVPKVCGNCTHGLSTSLDDIRCYKATPYLPTGLHCLACEDWEPCGTYYNPRVEYLRRKIEEAGK